MRELSSMLSMSWKVWSNVNDRVYSQRGYSLEWFPSGTEEVGV